MTEQQFADALGVSRAAIQQWEKEGGTAPKRTNQDAVAALLGISVAELVSGQPGGKMPSPLGLELAWLFDDVVQGMGPRDRARVYQAAQEAITRELPPLGAQPNESPFPAGTRRKQRA